MEDKDCIFCKMIRGEIAVDKLYEDRDMIIIKDINPRAPIHLLALIKGFHKSIDELTADESKKLGRVLHTIAKNKKLLNVEQGYTTLINQGKYQSVPHVHVHILSGKDLGF